MTCLTCFTEKLQNEKSRAKDNLHESEQLRQKEVRNIWNLYVNID